MTESELSTLLDAHDALVTACVDGRLTLDEFEGAYGDFPRAYGLDGGKASEGDRFVLRLFQKRIAFHFRVLDVLAGPLSAEGGAGALDDELGTFVPMVQLLRLRQLVDRYPEFKAEPGRGE